MRKYSLILLFFELMVQAVQAQPKIESKNDFNQYIDYWVKEFVIKGPAEFFTNLSGSIRMELEAHQSLGKGKTSYGIRNTAVGVLVYGKERPDLIPFSHSLASYLEYLSQSDVPKRDLFIRGFENEDIQILTEATVRVEESDPEFIERINSHGLGSLQNPSSKQYADTSEQDWKNYIMFYMREKERLAQERMVSLFNKLKPHSRRVLLIELFDFGKDMTTNHTFSATDTLVNIFKNRARQIIERGPKNFKGEDH